LKYENSFDFCEGFGEKMNGLYRVAIRCLGVVSGLVIGLTSFSNAYAIGPGADICRGCHEEKAASYDASVHGQKGNMKGPANAGECSTCHGDGTAHVAAGGGRGVGGMKNPSSESVSAEEKSQICLACHDTNRNLAYWDSGRHKKNDVSCNNCHSVHGTTSGNNDKMLKSGGPSISPYVTTVRQLTYETCNTCHKDKKAQILKTSHHPIVEGKVKCSDCHNPHGALSPAMVKGDSVNELCGTCHAEKRGPFINEHPPVAENCLVCHTPHGSNHAKLLEQSLPRLCQDCHDGASHLGQIWSAKDAFARGTGVTSGNPTPVTPNSPRAITRSCLNCHTQIHGSNAPANQGQRFLR
jgi:DmsE family decaheme c-type cytochrome